jgi:hypothetical protein
MHQLQILGVVEAERERLAQPQRQETEVLVL